MRILNVLKEKKNRIIKKIANWYLKNPEEIVDSMEPWEIAHWKLEEKAQEIKTKIYTKGEKSGKATQQNGEKDNSKIWNNGITSKLQEPENNLCYLVVLNYFFCFHYCLSVCCCRMLSQKF